MSARDVIDLSPSTHPHGVQVTSGSADVFAVDGLGRTTPLGTVGQGGVVPAAREHVHIRVVARLGSECEPLETIHANEVADGLTMFAECLVDRLGSYASDLQGIHPDHLPAALSKAIPAYVEFVRSTRLARVQEREELDSANRVREYSVLAADIRFAGSKATENDSDALTASMRHIGRYQGFQVRQMADGADHRTTIERLPGLAHGSGVRFRQVRLEGTWSRPRSSAFLGFLDDDTESPVALIPGPKGYHIFNGKTGETQPLTSALQSRLSKSAYEFTTPLPRERPVTWRDLVRLAMGRTIATWVIIVAMAALVAGLALATPIVTQYVLSVAVPNGSLSLIGQAGVALIAVALVSGAFSMVMFFAISRVTQLATARVQPALWDRMLSMPANFFRGFTSGDLSVRVMSADALQQLVSAQVVGAVLASVFSLVNLFLMFHYSVTLGLIGLGFILLTFAVLIWSIKRLQSLYTDSVVAQLQSTSWVVQLLTGIAKVRLAGAEKRLELPYLERVRQQMVALAKMTQVTGRVNAWFLLVVPAATACFFVVVVNEIGDTGSKVSTPTYIAFTASFSIIFGAVNGLIAVLSPIASAGPILRLLNPIMVAQPEADGTSEDPGQLTGAIEFRNVVFRYEPDAPIVLDRLSFKVAPGEMVALVGPSGSGKTSAVRLMLGFETAEDGQVLFDGRELHELDLDLVRSQMGVVIQNGQLTRTSILKNIVGAAGGSEDEAWRAAAQANLDDDIRAMPMKMQTMVDPTLLSGGQAQRVLLARALVHNPRIVLLDEATSALDNESQEKVTEALNNLGATRVVVAHRLSTIQNADRIIVIKAGRVVEEGTYDELVAQAGEFADLVKRQMA